MFLKSLTIKGFKSFADKAELALEPGVTVVVGPNGSGKSNVVDAIAWVLGAQAPSAVRSQKMDDVIFAGTSKKPALGRAEVALCIDNSAGLLPIDFAEVTITRTLFRTGESEYAINGVPCRLLDVQELLSDSGVGRMQHVIISQGQIDAVLNAKPTERRLIIEEAAGVLKFRKRKEKAERRLGATDANLTRVQDLLREVRRGLRPLERQAEAARRHGSLVDELSLLRRYVAGRELAQLRQRRDAVGRSRAEFETAATTGRERLAALDLEVLAAESELNATGANDISDELTRFEALRERGLGTGKVLAERQRSLAKERESSVDAALIASLEADQARLRAELAECETSAEALLPDAARVAEAEAALDRGRAEFEQRWGEGVAPTSGAAAEIRGELAALRSSLQRVDAESARAADRLRSLTDRHARLLDEAASGRATLAELDETRPALDAANAAAREQVLTVEAEIEEAQRVAAETESDRRSWAARAEALELALDAARAAAGAERLAGIAGVIGTVLDLVEVDDGWEAAFEAALGDALGAVVVADPAAARAAMASLMSDDATGAVLALGVDRPAAVAPAVGASVRAHVRSSRPEVDDLLDALVGAAVRVDGGWAAGLDVALAHPSAVVVTDDGARFGQTSWSLGAAGSGATGAALDEAREQLAAATVDADAARARAAACKAELAPHKTAATDARRAADEAANAHRRAAEAVARAERDAADIAAQIEAHGAEDADAAAQVAASRTRFDELTAMLPALEAEEAAAAEAAKALAEARTVLDERARAVSTLRSDLEVRAAQIDDRRAFLQHRLTEIDTRLERNKEAAHEAAVRREKLDARAAVLQGLAAKTAALLGRADERLVILRSERQAQNDAQRAATVHLDGLRKQRHAIEKEMIEARERQQRSELELNEIDLRIEGVVDTMRRELDIDPASAMALEAPELPETTSPAARVRELERELRLMGPINPLALEEHEALQERHEFLTAQLDDVKSSRRELQKVIKAIDEQIVQTFASAYADVAENFEQLFQTLFPGGTGKLSLTEPGDLLDTGIEVSAKPSGKNVRKLSLLSGGERSLTALAFLFAVFRSRPSPFYVMDEVEAALDDVNLHRFLELVAEFRQEAQLIVVSHQKRTMEAADILYGVTMQPGGSSKVVSERGAALSASA